MDSGTPSVIWKCPVCKVVMGHWSERALAAKARKHALKAHPELSRKGDN